MAESRRGIDTTAKLDEEAQKRRDLITRVVILLIFVGLVVGMIFLSKFISGN